MALHRHLLLAGLVAALAACGEDGTDTGDPGLCGLPADAAFVLAGPDLDSAPLIQVDESYVVQLIDGQPALIRLKLASPGVVDLLLDRPDALQSLDLDGDALEIPDPLPVATCPEPRPVAYTVDLGDPGVYTVQLGPLPGVSEVWLTARWVGPSQSTPSH
ncbi:MAG: hypothetical protein D6798_06035 [Deltaproteobacteria bacterium]|nr:MAG: hypothetical protein D6798_06035 [Deltaproteobacteria bacterium]